MSQGWPSRQRRRVRLGPFFRGEPQLAVLEPTAVGHDAGLGNRGKGGSGSLAVGVTSRGPNNPRRCWRATALGTRKHDFLISTLVIRGRLPIGQWLAVARWHGSASSRISHLAAPTSNSHTLPRTLWVPCGCRHVWGRHSYCVPPTVAGSAAPRDVLRMSQQ